MNLNSTKSEGFSNETAAVQVRKSSQFIMPAKLDTNSIPKGVYNVFPFCALGHHKIFNGYDSLVKWIIQQKKVIIDGYEGVFWDKIETVLNEKLKNEGLTVNWVRTDDFLKSPSEIDKLVEPFLGTADSVWGTKCLLELKDFYKCEELASQLPTTQYDINIVIGPGASLANWDAPLIYIDLPKNELQYRMRAGAINNLGSSTPCEPFLMYKRFYFVDWV